jgi:Dimerisation domain
MSFVSTYAMRCAAELEISNHIKEYGCPMPLHELARSIPIPPGKEFMLDRLMELLVHQGVFAKSEGGYLLTPISELMLAEGSNMGAFVCFMTEAFTKHWFFMSKWFKDTGTSTAFQMAHDGKQPWDIFKERPEMGNTNLGEQCSVPLSLSLHTQKTDFFFILVNKTNKYSKLVISLLTFA